jgi:DNA gyrase subunit A
MGRATQGVILINLEKRNDEIGSVCKVDSEPEELEEPQIEDEDDADYVNHKPEEEEENYT